MSKFKKEYILWTYLGEFPHGRYSFSEYDSEEDMKKAAKGFHGEKFFMSSSTRTFLEKFYTFDRLMSMLNI